MRDFLIERIVKFLSLPFSFSEAEYFTIIAGLQGVEKQLVSIEEKLDKEIAIRERLEKEVSDLKQRVVALQRKIEEIEIRLKTIS